jgi:hypothetical protein
MYGGTATSSGADALPAFASWDSNSVTENYPFLCQPP